MLAANTYVRYRDVRFSAVRYGNVVGSRGSVILLYANLIAQGKRVLPVTDPSMTRFWITLEQGVWLVLKALDEAQGGEVFVPKIPSMSVADLLASMPVECSSTLIGRRPGEKLHETLIGGEEGARTLDRGDHYIVLPDSADYRPGPWAEDAHPVAPGFSYESDTNSDWVTVEEMRNLVVSTGRCGHSE